MIHLNKIARGSKSAASPTLVSSILPISLLREQHSRYTFEIGSSLLPSPVLTTQPLSTYLCVSVRTSSMIKSTHLYFLQK